MRKWEMCKYSNWWSQQFFALQCSIRIFEIIIKKKDCVKCMYSFSHFYIIKNMTEGAPISRSTSIHDIRTQYKLKILNKSITIPPTARLKADVIFCTSTWKNSARLCRGKTSVTRTWRMDCSNVSRIKI